LNPVGLIVYKSNIYILNNKYILVFRLFFRRYYEFGIVVIFPPQLLNNTMDVYLVEKQFLNNAVFKVHEKSIDNVSRNFRNIIRQIILRILFLINIHDNANFQVQHRQIFVCGFV